MAEFEYGTDPFNPDTDGDGLRDGADPDPLTPQASGEIDLAQIGRAIILGATFGETGLPDGLFYGLVGEETASSPYYMVGWIGFSCLPVVGGIADIRDALITATQNGDTMPLWTSGLERFGSLRHNPRERPSQPDHRDRLH